MKERPHRSISTSGSGPWPRIEPVPAGLQAAIHERIGVLRAALLTVAIALPLAVTTAHADYRAGFDAWQSGDYARAAQEWKPLAEAGDAESQYALAVLYDHGEGVPQSDVEALKWYGKAADQGHGMAMANLGVMYETGQGVAQDPARAADWYRKAADKGIAQARSNLGLLYANGMGVEQSDEQARRLFLQAADQGYADAQYLAGLFCLEGRGGEADRPQAHMWFSLAAAQGDDKAAKSLEQLEGTMTPEELSRARQLADERAGGR